MKLTHAETKPLVHNSNLLPNLIIAGAPKAGTSSVFRWLADHPDVLASTAKETCYFADPGTHIFDENRNFLTGGLEGYERFFVAGLRTPHLIVEATPTYMYSELALRELPWIPSRPHFLFLLREPASQIRSLFRYFQTNWDWIPQDMSFSAFLEVNRRGSERFRGNELAQHALRYAAYLDFLLRWRDACGANRIHVFLFEHAVGDSRSFMSQLAERFGLDTAFYQTYTFPRENEGYAVRSNVLQAINISLRKRIPQGRLYRAARFLYRTINTRSGAPENRQNDELESRLSEAYREPNARLAEAFNLDLRPWASVHQQCRDRACGTLEQTGLPITDI